MKTILEVTPTERILWKIESDESYNVIVRAVLDRPRRNYFEVRLTSPVTKRIAHRSFISKTVLIGKMYGAFSDVSYEVRPPPEPPAQECSVIIIEETKL